jgi:hypothetical protein
VDLTLPLCQLLITSTFRSLPIAIGGALGFVGVEQVKAVAGRVFSSRFGGGDANQ